MNPNPNIQFNPDIVYQGNPLFEPRYINLEYLFYKIYIFLAKIVDPSYRAPDIARRTDVIDYTKSIDPSSVTSTSSGGNFALFTSFAEGLLYFLIIFFITVILYVVVRMLEVRAKEDEYANEQIENYKNLKEEEKAKKEKAMVNGSVKNSRWSKVVENTYSHNEADWRVAILDADMMLDELTNNLGIRGENLGEKLKNADRDHFRSLSAAWEAHIARNKIAHAEPDFVLTAREAGRIVALYEEVFREFDYI